MYDSNNFIILGNKKIVFYTCISEIQLQSDYDIKEIPIKSLWYLLYKPTYVFIPGLVPVSDSVSMFTNLRLEYGLSCLFRCDGHFFPQYSLTVCTKNKRKRVPLMFVG